jgi:hypothetical protein
MTLKNKDTNLCKYETCGKKYAYEYVEYIC